MDAILDCNIWVEAVAVNSQVPKNAAQFANTALGKILNSALRGRKVKGEKLTIVVSRHILLTSDHVCAQRGWSEPGEVARWMSELIARLQTPDVAAVILDGTKEDYPALVARAAKLDGAEDAEDEAVLRAAIHTNATLVTEDRDLAYSAGRRGVKVHGPSALIEMIGGLR
jgi:predicted nucleic acid-binding protein